MRTIKQSSQFKRDLKREAKGPHRKTLKRGFVALVNTLASDQPLADKHRDHALTGDWKDHCTASWASEPNDPYRVPCLSLSILCWSQLMSAQSQIIRAERRG
ncbi:MAG: type II toxin-antitoxin system YafQ family toxin [Salinisphaera sp.]|nr:type II toxin-antitoxin system YafQ family toxin [Salinisphaera sp.]